MRSSVLLLVTILIMFSWLACNSTAPTKPVAPLAKITAKPTPPPIQTLLYPFVENEKWGYIDASGQVVIKPSYDLAKDFTEGLAYVYDKNKRAQGYIDNTGKPILSDAQLTGVQFARGFETDLSSGRILVKTYDKEPHFGYVDQAGKLVIPAVFDQAEPFHEGFAVIAHKLGNSKDGPIYRYNYIDTTGKELSAQGFPAAQAFSEGLAVVAVGEDPQHRKYGYIDTTGKLVIEAKFDTATAFHEGLAAFGINTKYGYIDTTGQQVIAPQYRVAGQFTQGLAAVLPTNDSYSYIDSTGKQVLTTKFKHAEPFSEGLAAVWSEDDQCGYIDTSGKLIIDTKYSKCETFDRGLARAVLEFKEAEQILVVGYFNHAGQVVFQYSGHVEAHKD